MLHQPIQQKPLKLQKYYALLYLKYFNILFVLFNFNWAAG